MPEPVDLGFAFGLEPRAAVEYFRSKGYQIAFNWDALTAQAHARAFTVARAMNLDVLSAIRGELEQALAEGATLAQFRARLQPRLESLGWWGRQVMERPDGTAQLVQTGSPRRLETIYRTNLQSAYMAGRYREFWENREARPFWQYVAVMDSRTRPAHAALHGKIFRFDDPIWESCWPPNGYNCFPADTPVRADAELGLRSWYAGEMVELRTRGGARLTVTANHPVLTSRGWLPARLVHQGDKMLRDRGAVYTALPGIVDDAKAPSRAEDLFKSLAAQGLRVVPMSSHDFHGDAALRKPEIAVAGSDRHLVNEHAISREQLGGDWRFRRADVRLGRDPNGPEGPARAHLVISRSVRPEHSRDISCARSGLPGERSFRHEAAAIGGKEPKFQLGVLVTAGGPRGAELALDGAPVVLEGLPLDGLGGRSAPDADALKDELTTQGVAAAAGIFGELIQACAGLVAIDEVTDVRQFDWAGHVFDFQTRSGLIVAGGLVVHNCRCRVRARSQRDMERNGLHLSESGADLTRWQEVDPRSGEVRERVSYKGPGMDRAFSPDRGFAANQALAAARPEISIAAKAQGLGDADAVAAALREVQRESWGAWAAWVGEVLAAGVSRGQSRVAGYAMPAEVAFADTVGARWATGAIGVEDRLIIGRKASRYARQGVELTVDEWRQLPIALVDRLAVLWDASNGSFLYILRGAGVDEAIRVVVRPGILGRRREVHDSLRWAQRVNLGDLRGAVRGGLYRLVDGSL